jgi:uncharacterized membrane protein
VPQNLRGGSVLGTGTAFFFGEQGGIVAHSRIGDFVFARADVVDELHAAGKDDAEIARTISIDADQVLLIRTRHRVDDLD